VPDFSGSIPVKISVGDGRYVDAEEMMRLFSSPRAETPKIKAKTSPIPGSASKRRSQCAVFFARKGLTNGQYDAFKKIQVRRWRVPASRL
jgi:hypothetical protein